MTDEKLIEQYLANGGTITVVPPEEEKVTPYVGKLQPSFSKIEYDSSGKRIYKNLGKTFYYPQDETMLNYG